MTIAEFGLLATAIQYGIGSAKLTKGVREWIVAHFAIMVSALLVHGRHPLGLCQVSEDGRICGVVARVSFADGATCASHAHLGVRVRVFAAIIRFLACPWCTGAWVGLALHVGGLSPGFVYAGRGAPIAAALTSATLVAVLRSLADLTATVEKA